MDKKNMFKSYAFDIDDNLRSLNTKIFLRRDTDNELIELSTEEYSVVRANNFKGFKDVNYEEAMINFRKENDELFINQIMESKPAHSWNDFVECVNNASIFSWITARGHSRNAFKKAFRNMVVNNFDGISYKSLISSQKLYMDIVSIDYSKMTDEDILDFYIDLCKFYGMEDPESSLEVIGDEACHDPSVFKPKALLLFKGHVLSEFKKIADVLLEENIKMKIGFSDDDKKTIDFMVKIFSKDMDNDNKVIHLSVYDTSEAKKRVL